MKIGTNQLRLLLIASQKGYVEVQDAIRIYKLRITKGDINRAKWVLQDLERINYCLHERDKRWYLTSIGENALREKLGYVPRKG